MLRASAFVLGGNVVVMGTLLFLLVVVLVTGAHLINLTSGLGALSHLLQELDGTNSLAVVPGADHNHTIQFLTDLDHDLITQ